MAHDRYISPFSTRYASDEMQYTFSDDNKFRTWRRLWIALAKAEQKQGLDITDEQIAELEAHKDDINYEEAVAREKLVRHDVMSHVYAYGLQCPKAKGIIHLGATSCYVGDNTDVIIMREGLQLVRKKLIGVLANLADFAEQYKDMPCLAYTHCQPAQLTTVGKRATLWMNEFYMDLQEIDHQISQLALRGVKGTTGTQASFIELFNGDSAKVKAVEADVCAQMGFDKVVPVCGQTYSRKVDYNVLSAIAGLAQSAMKMATDIRLLANFKEMEEPFEKNQIGSSAMPYKRNPMRCERICALSRYLMVDVLNPAITAGTQWFERTLDDSANKRMGRKYPVLRPPGKERFVRFKTLGKRYTPEAIQTRILYPQNYRPYVEKAPSVQHGRLHSGKKPHRKLTGLRALYYRYLYELGAIPRKPRRPSYVVRQDAYKLDQRIRQMEFLSKHNIDTLAQLETHRQAMQTEIRQLLTKRKQLPKTDDVQSQCESVNTALKQLRQEERLCRKIAEHSLEVQQHLTEARCDRAEQQQREQEHERDRLPNIDLTL